MMKINKPIAFVSLETVFIEIERSKVSVSAFIIFKTCNLIHVFENNKSGYAYFRDLAVE